MREFERLEALRRWAVADPEDPDELENLRDALTFAEGYLRGAGVPEREDPVRELLLRKMALYYYEHRSADSKGAYPEPPPDLNALVLQLRSS
ncbi:MAG: phage gp6-like head-tail connector protein [Deltaproteobacteria bacterium]|nr:phage gp6-like head-tail connector protein [Deltaproteobacteria bacterium]